MSRIVAMYRSTDHTTNPSHDLSGHGSEMVPTAITVGESQA
jgi:hypothetical protein